VLFHIDCAVNEGELLTVLGSNASGKSTLLRTIIGDVHVSAGDIGFAGRRVTYMPIHERVAAGIGLSPEGRRVLPTLTVEENLVAGTYGLPDTVVREQFAAVHRLFPLLAARARQRAGFLSGGEQQMLAIGRALMHRPRLLLVDEPSIGLAPVVVEELYEAFRALCHQGVAVIVAEQFQRFEDRWSDRWLVLERGTVVATGTRADAHLLFD
jgi:ABC-type branched-subunit amino acid transport system ATPase component